MKIFITAPMGAPQRDATRSLESDGHTVVVGDRPVYSEAELIDCTRDADAIVAASHEHDRISRKVLEASERLRLVVAPFVGVDHIDVDAATELGILVANSPALENVVGVAEASIGLMLSLLKRVKRNEARLRGGGWRHTEDQGDLLYGKTVGIVGLGRIGSHVARRLGPWDVSLLANDPYVTREYASRFSARLTDLPTLLRNADFVTLYVVLTDETQNLIGEQALRQMKPTAFLINTSRGGVVDDRALVRAIEEGWIAGAALDTFEPEPLPADSPLRRLDPERVILTPHNVGLSEAGNRGNWALTVLSILQAFQGRVPDPLKNPEAVGVWRDRLRKLNG